MDNFVADFVGADRALKRLSLVTAGEAFEANLTGGSAPAVPRSVSLRDALAIMLQHGTDMVRVTDEEEHAIGVLTLARIRERATQAEPQASVA